MLAVVLNVLQSGSLECAPLVVPTALDTWLVVLVIVLAGRICWFAAALALALLSLAVHKCSFSDAPSLVVVMCDD
jgi:hypothetical protein